MKIGYPIQLTVIVVLIFNGCESTVFARCELARQLVKLGLDRDKINDWVCLVENESGRNTSAIGGPNKNGSYDYGLFQINGGWWCSLGVEGGDCHMKCEDLIDDDVTDDIICVEKIYRRHKFSAWHGWTKRCMGKKIADVTYCFDNDDEKKDEFRDVTN